MSFESFVASVLSRLRATPAKPSSAAFGVFALVMARWCMNAPTEGASKCVDASAQAGFISGSAGFFSGSAGFFSLALFRDDGALDAPWGVAIAPEGFGEIAGHLLVGNYGDGRVNVYKVAATMGRFNAVFDGALTDVSRRPIAIEGLRSLTFGRGGGFDASRLYFTAGSAERATGLLGYLSVR
ncbi:MAG: TIGR03118 family protein [Polyangiales bacterium]